MYNGIGLPTPRGSGTNGFVQRNLAHVSKKSQMKSKIIAAPDQVIERKTDPELIMHQKKREIEAKCLRLRAELEDEGLSERRIEKEVDRYRERKLRELAQDNDKVEVKS